MRLTGLLDAVRAEPTLAALVADLADASAAAQLDLTAPPGLRPFVTAALAGTGRTVLAVTATSRESDDLAAALGSLVGPDAVATFPSWETLPHERLSPRADTVGRRLAVLRRLRHPDPDDPAAGRLAVVVAPVRAVLQPIIAGLGELVPVALRPGQDADLGEVVGALADAAYHRVELVEKRGEFAVRGGILDVFPPTEEHPLRVEFWGDTVEEIRYFAVADQRSLEAAPVLWAPPCRELLLTPAVRARAAALAGEHPGLVDVLDRIAEGIPVDGMEAFAPVLVDRMVLLGDELPAGALVLAADPERIRLRATDLVRTSQEFLEASWATAAGGGRAPIDLGAAAYRSLGEVRTHALALGQRWWALTPFSTDPADAPPPDGTAAPAAPTALRLAAVATPSYRGDTPAAVADVRGWVGRGWRVAVVTEGHGPAERVAEVLRQADLGVAVVGDLDAPPAERVVTVTTGALDRGFACEPLRLAVVTEADLAGSRSSSREMRRLPSRRRNQVDPLTLSAGDLVVHEQHGVGRFVQMAQRTVQGATREYLVLEYAPAKRGQPGDRLYVPTDALDQVTRYVGGEAPALHRLGGADWAKTKGRARKAVKEIAAELIRLYAARTSTPGHAFGPDTPWQRELEDAFGYVETPDQLSAIDEVKRDMERPVPMDRLICGDVGYGKTEIAVRAAFKAVADGKQVAVLVPTTLLARQHFAVFTERYATFPVAVRALSRFETDAEAAEVLAGLESGAVDVVIGTHRLLQAGVRFHDLGLAVVDEEQRFGVEHKEQLKRLRASVDMLTMSATPIPRTLEMAVTGIREMSVIATPPEERHPILTFVGPYDEKTIAAAVHRELLRDGQVFYVHNRVESIDKAAKRLADLVPEARIAVAHGQMGEEALEQVMIAFGEREVDVLVCTTIIETGLDVPNANTLILERADLLGLAQLHQLRGRVGRARERAYAYFLYPPEAPLTETAHDRLATIAQNAELGAGMAVAMKDLEIRGSGDLLGGEQSGHIAAVGFDLYVRLVGEAVAAYKGEAPEEVAEVKVDLPVDAHLPHGYIPAERLRLEAYRKIASAATDAAVEQVRAELVDRYGPVPQPVDNLLAVARFRAHARAYGLSEVSLQSSSRGSVVRMSPVVLPDSAQLRLARLYPSATVKHASRSVLLPAPSTGGVLGQPLRDLPLLAWCRQAMDQVLSPVPTSAAS